MTRKEIIEELKEYFKIQELVCPHTYNKWGDNISWQFLSTEYLHCLLVIRRDILKRGMTCNNYHIGAKRSESGLRCNICSIPKEYTLKNQRYQSAHLSGCGGDFITSGMTAEDVRKAIAAKADLLPSPIRMEADVTWLHFDIFDSLNGSKVSYFKG